MLVFVREISRWLACLGLVLVRLEVVNNGVWIRLVFLRQTTVIPPGIGNFVFPSFDNCVAVAPKKIGSAQRVLVGVLSGYFVPIAGLSNYLGPFFKTCETIGTPVPMAAVVLEDSFTFWAITINLVAQNAAPPPVTTSLVVNVNAPLLGLVLHPTNCLDSETAVGVKGLFESRLRGKDPIAGTVKLGLAT